MRKILKLYQNEMTKILRKPSIIVLLILLIAGIFATGGLLKFQDYLYSNNDFIYNSSPDTQYLDDTIHELQKNLDYAKQEIDNAETEEEKQKLQEQIINFEADIVYFTLLKDNPGADSSFLTTLAQNISDFTRYLKRIELIPEELRSEDDKALIAEYNSMINKYTEIFKHNDYIEYLELKNDEIRNGNQSDEEKAIEIRANEFRKRINPNGLNTNIISLKSELIPVENMIQTYLKNSIAVLNNTDPETKFQLTPDKRAELENTAKVIEYKIENSDPILDTKDSNTMTNISGSAMQVFFSVGMFIISIMMIVLAGGAISSEISTGSIKSLIIAPVKRYKIYTAKILSLLSVFIFSIILLYIISILSNLIYFGTENISSYIYASNGIVHSMNFFVYQFAYIFISSVDTLVYMIFALMLSTLTRNTALSVGLSLAISLIGGNVCSVLALFVQDKWIHFLPFTNLGLASRIFETDTMNMAMGAPLINFPSIAFSLIYIAVMLICMTYTAYDSFCRRDIK